MVDRTACLLVELALTPGEGKKLVTTAANVKIYMKDEHYERMMIQRKEIAEFLNDRSKPPLYLKEVPVLYAKAGTTNGAFKSNKAEYVGFDQPNVISNLWKVVLAF